ncbi:MAG: hypothetical protein ACRDYC_04895, partial [Acidimicrobiales bacterium]
GGTALVTENQYLQIGDELGLLGLGLYVSVLIMGLRRLGTRRYLRAAHMFVPGGTASVVSATMVGIVFLQPFIFLQVSWIFFALLGLAVSVAEDSPSEKGHVGSGLAGSGWRPLDGGSGGLGGRRGGLAAAGWGAQNPAG